MKRLLLFISTLLCANVLFAQSYFEIDSLEYEVTSTNPAEVEVNDAKYSITIANIPETVSYDGINYSVTSIGDYAFNRCSSLTSVTIPNSVTSIGDWAFNSCSSLTSVTIPNSVTSIGREAFWGCSSLTSIDIPNSVTSIGISAFGNCSSLTSVILPNNANIDSSAFESTGGINVGGIYYGGKETVNIGNYTFNNVGFIKFYLNGNATTITPSEVSVIDCDENKSGDIVIPSILSYEGINYSVTSIGDYAFSSCSSLTSIDIPNSVTSIGAYAFSRCSSLTSVTIPNSVTSIGHRAFEDCSSLTSIDIPNSVTSIGSVAFAGCSSLTSVTIPNSVTSIGNSAFSGCRSLTSVTIPNSVTSIGDWSFGNCSSLTSITIPNSVTSIGIYAFKNCRSLTSVTIPNSVTSIGDYTFLDCSSLTSVTIPNSVTSIGREAFYGCSSLTSITIPNSVTSIGISAFQSCSSLTSVTIPNSVTSIGVNAFYYCSSLTSITIPNSVTSIGAYAFSRCSSLTSVTCLAETAPLLGNNVFDVFSSTPSTKVLNIPFGSDYSSWQSATTWSKTNYLIQEGETKELSTNFTINNKTGLINEGVLRIKQNGQLINKTATNVGGIFEVETPTLANDKWSFIGAPFNNYKLEAVKPGTKDISISLFDYETGNWSNDFATIEDEVGAGEGFFAWSFAAEPTVFTTYGDGAEEYNFENPPEYALNNGAVTVTKNLTTHEDGGNWLALSNPYTFKLDVNKFLSEQSNIKGEVVYRFNGETWDDVQAGVINMTEGFFVNYETEGVHSVSFSKFHRYDGAKKAETKKDYMKLLLNDGERTTRLLFAQNDKAKQGDDLFDANKLFSPLEITEPYFVTEGVALVKEEVNALPYTANLNIRNYENKEVTISIDNIPEGVTVFLLDNGQDIKMNGGVEYTTTITEGENADRFQLLVKKQQRIERNTNNQITIKNNNRQITITSDITNLNIEVYNNLGQKVFATKDYNFTLDQLPSGSYVVKAFYGRVNQSQKIVIE